MKNLLRVLALATTGLSALAVVPAAAQDYGADVAALTVLQGWREGATHKAGLAINLKDGWKTYWRAPGEAGIPPVFDWSGSRNLASVGLEWPVPLVFDQGGTASIGYEGGVVFPLTLRARDASAPISLRGRIEMGVCEDVCIPVTLDIAAELPAGVGGRDPRIVSAFASLPLGPREAGVRGVSCAITPTRDGLRIDAKVSMPSLAGNERLVIESGDPALWISQGVTRRNGTEVQAASEAMHVDGAGFALERSQLRLTVIGARTAVDILGCPSAP